MVPGRGFHAHSRSIPILKKLHYPPLKKKKGKGSIKGINRKITANIQIQPVKREFSCFKIKRTRNKFSTFSSGRHVNVDEEQVNGTLNLTACLKEQFGSVYQNFNQLQPWLFTLVYKSKSLSNSNDSEKNVYARYVCIYMSVYKYTHMGWGEERKK